MLIREYQPDDLKRLTKIHHGQGIDYPMPDVENPLFDLKMVAEDDSGELRQAIILRVTSETYLLMDREAGTPRERWKMFVALHESTHRRAWARGYEDVHCWIPPDLARTFGKRLMKLGWTRPEWVSFTKILSGE